jgi:hypothetical protein
MRRIASISSLEVLIIDSVNDRIDSGSAQSKSSSIFDFFDGRSEDEGRGWFGFEEGPRAGAEGAEGAEGWAASTPGTEGRAARGSEGRAARGSN